MLLEQDLKDSGKIYSKSYGRSLFEIRNANGNLHSAHGLPSVVTRTHVLFHNDGLLSIAMKYSDRILIEGILERVGRAMPSTRTAQAPSRRRAAPPQSAKPLTDRPKSCMIETSGG